MAGILTLMAEGLDALKAWNAPYSSGWHWQSVFGAEERLPGAGHDYKVMAGDAWRNSVVAIVMDWQQRAFVQATCRLEKRGTGDKWEPVPEHPINALLDDANPVYDGTELWMASLLSWDIDGNSYWRVRRGAGGKGLPLQLWWMPWWMIEPKATPDGWDLSHYEYMVQGRTYRIEREDLIHIRNGLDPKSALKGLSAMKSLYREIYTDNEYATYSAALARNFGVVPYVISPANDATTDVTSEAREKILALWADRTTGENRGKPLVMNYSLKMDKAGLSPTEMDLGNMRQVPEDRLCAALGISPMVVGLTSGAAHKTYANYQEGRRGAWLDKIGPTQNVMSDQLERQLFPLYGLKRGQYRLGWDRSEVEALQKDREALYKTISLAYQSDWLKRSEAREEAGKEYDEADNVYYSQAQSGGSSDFGGTDLGDDVTGELETKAVGHRGHTSKEGRAHQGHLGKGDKAGAAKPQVERMALGDGTERDVQIEVYNGTRVVVPSDLDAKKQQISADELKQMLDQIPEAHRGVLTEVRLLDGNYVEGRKVFKNTAGVYDPKTGVVEIFRNDQHSAEGVRELVAGTVRHEAAHALQDKLGPRFQADWKAAVKKDAGFITDYARTNIFEDQAETIMHHWSPDRTQRRIVSTFFENRAAVLKKYGVEPGG